MSVKNSISSIPAATFNSTALMNLVYQPVNIGGLPDACFEIIISNLTNTEIIYSFDGVTDHNYMNPEQILILRGGNGASQPNNSSASWAKGTILYVRGTAGVGLIVLAGLYQNQGA
jgi:hypothetical protein